MSNSITKILFKKKFKAVRLVRLFCRNSILTKMFYKTTVFIHKGQIFARILLNKYNVGYKLGEFALTRKPFRFTKKKKKR